MPASTDLTVVSTDSPPGGYGAAAASPSPSPRGKTNAGGCTCPCACCGDGGAQAVPGMMPFGAGTGSVGGGPNLQQCVALLESANISMTNRTSQRAVNSTSIKQVGWRFAHVWCASYCSSYGTFQGRVVTVVNYAGS